MLTGSPPFSGSLDDISRAIRERNVNAGPLAGAPPGVIGVVERCLEKRPENRYQSARELTAALERAALPSADAPTLAGASERGPAVAGAGSMTVVDVRGGTSVPAVTEFLGPGSYTVVVRNATSEPTLVDLRAEDKTASLEFQLPPMLALDPGESKTVQVYAAPKTGQTVAPGQPFTIVAADVGEIGTGRSSAGRSANDIKGTVGLVRPPCWQLWATPGWHLS